MDLTRRNFLMKVGQAGGYGAAFLTMQHLGLMAVPEANAMPLAIESGSGKGIKVVILGGGIAGLVAAYEMGKAGYSCTVLEARQRPGGRNWTVRNGAKIEFNDGTTQTANWDDSSYFNAGPARLPSIHKTMLGYCKELGVPLEVEVNTSRSSLLQNDAAFGGKASSSVRRSTTRAVMFPSFWPSAFTKTLSTRRFPKKTRNECWPFCEPTAI